MTLRSLCCECDGTGWIPYRSETVDGELEEAYYLCSNCYAPRYCMGSRAGHSCPRPGIVRYAVGYYCKEHSRLIRDRGDADHTHEACYGLPGPAALG